jgi:hypothetical protein
VISGGSVPHDQIRYVSTHLVRRFEHSCHKPAYIALVEHCSRICIRAPHLLGSAPRCAAIRRRVRSLHSGWRWRTGPSASRMCPASPPEDGTSARWRLVPGHWCDKADERPGGHVAEGLAREPASAGGTRRAQHVPIRRYGQKLEDPSPPCGLFQLFAVHDQCRSDAPAEPEMEDSNEESKHPERARLVIRLSAKGVAAPAVRLASTAARSHRPSPRR